MSGSLFIHRIFGVWECVFFIAGLCLRWSVSPLLRAYLMTEDTGIER